MKFQKIKDNRTNIEYDWVLVLETEDDVINFHEKSFQPKIRPMWDNLISFLEGKSHLNSQLATCIWLDLNKEKSILECTLNLLDKVLNNKLKIIQDGNVIYQTKSGGYFSGHEYIVVLEEMFIDGDNILFPQYTEKDIKTKQWEGGKHWYAYVGDIWVNFDGKNKFDSEYAAKRAAKHEMRELNHKFFEFKNT